VGRIGYRQNQQKWSVATPTTFAEDFTNAERLLVLYQLRKTKIVLSFNCG
jgi:hypothetical protein